MPTTQITLIGETEYNVRFPPNNAKKGYVAKITGRAPGAMKYEREFFGERADLLEGDEGLYETQTGEKKGGFSRLYHVVLSHPEHGLIISINCEDEVPKIAKLIGSKVDIHDAVEVVNLRPSQRHEGRMIFDAVARTASKATANARSTTLDAAVEKCVEVLRLMPESEQKKALAIIKKTLMPKPAKEEIKVQ